MADVTSVTLLGTKSTILACSVACHYQRQIRVNVSAKLCCLGNCKVTHNNHILKGQVALVSPPNYLISWHRVLSPRLRRGDHSCVWCSSVGNNHGVVGVGCLYKTRTCEWVSHRPNNSVSYKINIFSIHCVDIQNPSLGHTVHCHHANGEQLPPLCWGLHLFPASVPVSLTKAWTIIHVVCMLTL